MGLVFTRMLTVWLNQQQNRAEVRSLKEKSTTNKRKRSDVDDRSAKKKIVKNNENDDDRLTLSPRLPPIVPKSTINSKRSSSAMTLFKCQLCSRYLPNKDSYLDHMFLCAIQCQASIRIIRTNQREKRKAKNSD